MATSTTAKGENSSVSNVSQASSQGKEAAQKPASQPVTSPPPDGGYVAWLQVLGSFLLTFNNWGLLASFGVFEAFYETTYLQDYSPSEISWIGTIQGALLILVGIFSGPIFDLYEYGFRSMLMIGSIGIVFGLMMLSLAREYYSIFLAQGLLIGICQGLLYIPSIACVSTYFTKKRGLALGLSLGGSSFGGVIYPIVFRRLQPMIGFGWTVRIMGFVALVTLLIPVLIMKPRVSLRKGKARKLVDLRALKEIPFAFFTLSGFFVFLGYYVPIFLTPSFARTYTNASTDLSFYLLAVLNGSSFIGRVLPSLIGDRIGAEKVLVFGNLAGGIVAFGWIGVHSLGGFIAFCIIYGILSGTIATMPASTLPLLCPSIDQIGTRLGMAWFPAGIAVLLSTPIANALAQASSDGILGAQVWTGAVLLTGVVLQISPLVHLTQRRRAAKAATAAATTS